jgi:hypothetical protein
VAIFCTNPDIAALILGCSRWAEFKAGSFEFLESHVSTIKRQDRTLGEVEIIDFDMVPGSSNIYVTCRTNDRRMCLCLNLNRIIFVTIKDRRPSRRTTSVRHRIRDFTFGIFFRGLFRLIITEGRTDGR